MKQKVNIKEQNTQ